ncbi:MAG: APC family permease [Candidatus Dormibacteraeota bacterium]|nr:APC family permease [Candidatus Dormibacteraeota bacterium]
MATIAATGAAPAPTEREDKGLKSGALGLASSIIIAVSSTAPAYSLAAALGVVVVVVNFQSPAVIVLAFIPMFLVAVAFRELNRSEPDCGTTFTWATRAFGHKVGWMGGWGIIAADVIVMANLAAIAGSYLFSFFGLSSLASSTFWVTLAGVAFIILMTWVAYRGIEVSARVQMALLAVELTMLAIFAIAALVQVYSGHGAVDANGHALSISPSWSWFNPFQVGDFGALIAGLLVATFIYWGWDSAMSVNEETEDATRTPGLAVVIATLILLLTFAVVAVAAQAFAGVGNKDIGLANPANTADVISGLGTAVFGGSALGGVMAKLLVLMVVSSTAASCQTTIMPTARASLSMAAFKAIPDRFARIHPRYLTPTWSTVGMGIVSIVFYVVLTIISKNILTDTIASLGLMIAFYYGLTGFAATWYYRGVLTRSASDMLNKGVMPLLGGLFLAGMFIYGLKYYADPGNTTTHTPAIFGHSIGGVAVIGVGTLLLGVVLMFIYQAIRPDFFRGETLTKATVLEVIGASRPDAALRVPDASSQEALIVPPDPEVSGLSEEEIAQVAHRASPGEPPDPKPE